MVPFKAIFLCFFFFALLRDNAVLLAKPKKGIWLSSLSRSLALAKEQKKPILIDIYAPWCNYCRRLREHVYPSPKVRNISDTFIKLRVNGEKDPTLMRRYQTVGFPTILFLDQNGAYLGQVNGFIRKFALAKKLRKIKRIADQYQIILTNQKKNPHSLHWNFEAGNYYFKAKKYKLSHKYFLTAWKFGKTSNRVSKKKQRRALYNAAINSMHLDRYSEATYEWSLYVKNYPDINQDYIYARYYRGLSLYYHGKKHDARDDLAFAKHRLKNRHDRDTANRLLGMLGSLQ